MPSNTRGKLKEQLEGIHRNTEAIKQHCNRMIFLVGDKNTTVVAAVNALAKINDVLDESAQRIYGIV